MYRGSSVAVVVPAYNEAGFVGDVVRSVPAYVDRVYVVDDASTDATWAEIRQVTRELERSGADDDAPTSDAPSRETAADGRGAASVVDGRRDDDSPSDGADDDRVVPIRHAENQGVGGAIKTGYRRALADGYDVTAVMAGDGQMDPEHLERLLDPIVEGRAEYAKGNRLGRAEWRAEMPRFRLVGNAVLTLLTKVASGYWRVGDPQNGYTAISGAALEDAEFDRMYEFYGYCNDLLVRLAAADARVADVPVPPTYGDEQSHIDLRSYVPRVSWMLLRAFVWRLGTELRRDRNPAAVLYPAGALAGLLGLGRTIQSIRVRVAREREGAGGDGDGGDGSDGGDRPAAALLASVGLFLVAAVVDWFRKLPLAFRTDGGD